MTTKNTLSETKRNDLRVARIRGVGAGSRPPLPVNPQTGPAPARTQNRPALEQVVRLPWRPQPNGVAIEVRRLDAGRLSWRELSARLGWQPGTRLAATVDRHWVHLTPTTDVSAATEVDRRGRVVVDGALRTWLGITADSQVVARIPTDCTRLELCSFAVVALALDAVDEAGLHIAGPARAPAHTTPKEIRQHAG